jgi:hypothetical protein
MTLELNESAVYSIKELIYREIDRLGGFDQLSDELQAICLKLSERGRESAL